MLSVGNIKITEDAICFLCETLENNTSLSMKIYCIMRTTILQPDNLQPCKEFVHIVTEGFVFVIFLPFYDHVIGISMNGQITSKTMHCSDL